MTLCLFLGTITLYSQSYSGKGDQKLNVGYEGYGYGTGIKATFDQGLGEMFSIGAGASAFFNGDENDYFIFARTQIHLGIVFDLPSKFDIYPNLELGYLSSERVGIAGHLGFRYFVSEKIGLFAEVGSTGAIGLSINV